MCVYVGGLSSGGVKAAKYLSKVYVSLSLKAAEKEGCDKTQIRDLRKKKKTTEGNATAKTKGELIISQPANLSSARGVWHQITGGTRHGQKDFQKFCKVRLAGGGMLSLIVSRTG